MIESAIEFETATCKYHGGEIRLISANKYDKLKEYWNDTLMCSFHRWWIDQ